MPSSPSLTTSHILKHDPAQHDLSTRQFSPAGTAKGVLGRMCSVTTGNSSGQHSFILIVTWARRTARHALLNHTYSKGYSTVIQYSTKKLHGRQTACKSPLSVIKNCQVIRMLTAYAVAIGRTVARGWRVVVRSKQRYPEEASPRVSDSCVGDKDTARAICFHTSCGVRHRRPGLHGGFLGCASGLARWVTKSNKHYRPARG